MSLIKSLLFFLLAWIIFLAVGTGFGSLPWIIPQNWQSVLRYILPFLSTVVAYGLIWVFLIKGRYKVFSSSDFSQIQERLWIPILLIILGLQLVNQSFLDVYHQFFFPEYENLIRHVRNDWSVPAILSSVVAIFMAPVLEELLFRKVIFGNLLKKNSFLISMLVSSFYFAIIHFPMYGKMLPVFILGCTSAFVYYKTGKLFYSILLHFANNFISMFTDVFYPDFWDNLHRLHFGFAYWAVILVGLWVFIFGIRRFSKAVQKKPQENL